MPGHSAQKRKVVVQTWLELLVLRTAWSTKSWLLLQNTDALAWLRGANRLIDGTLRFSTRPVLNGMPTVASVPSCPYFVTAALGWHLD